MVIREDIDSKLRPVSMTQIASINPPDTSIAEVTGRFNAGLDRNRGNTDNDYVAARWALNFKHQLFKSWKLQAFHNHHLRWSVEDTSGYVFNSEIGLRIPIIDRMQATVQFNLDRNNSPAQDAKKNDYDTLITGGYTW
jgi:putative salt-induced outer membrane protein YdiY